MITPRVKTILITQARNVAEQIVALDSHQPLVIREDQKYDRIDSKLLKEANKLNQRQQKAGYEGNGQGANRKKGLVTYRSYTLQFKKQLVESIREENEATTTGLSRIIRMKAKEYGIHPKNITRWYHTKELKKKQGGRRALYPQMELRLANFIRSNPKMKRKYILHQARQIMEDLHIPGRENFNFSKGWYERFRERLNKYKVKLGVKLEQVKKEEEGDEIKSEDNDSEDQNIKAEGSDCDSVKKEESQDSFEDQFMCSGEDCVKLEEEMSEGEQMPVDQPLPIKHKLRSHFQTGSLQKESSKNVHPVKANPPSTQLKDEIT